MSNEPDLASAYALQSTEDVKDLYANWAKTYDRDFVEAQGYQVSREIADAFTARGGKGPVLDVGSGTGIGGVELAARGVSQIDGLDLSEDMHRIAEQKGIYRDLITADITAAPPQIGPYNGIVSAGTFTFGHVGPEGLPFLLSVAASGCLFVLSINAKHFESAGFKTAFVDLSDRITDFETTDVRIYDDRADIDHRHDMARLVSFRLR